MLAASVTTERALMIGTFSLGEEHNDFRAVVADELEAAAQRLVARIQSLKPEQYGRRGIRSDGAEFTVLTLIQYFLHDVIHHLWDVTGQQDAAASLALE